MMRKKLAENEEFCTIIKIYVAYIFNFLVKENFSKLNIKQILEIMKYFNNNQYANVCFKPDANSPNFIIPGEVQWNLVMLWEIILQHGH